MTTPDAPEDGARYGQTEQQGDAPVPTGAGPVPAGAPGADPGGDGGDGLGGTDAGDPLAGVTAEGATPPAEATPTGTPAAEDLPGNS
jgi:hypothetical protein